MSEFHPNRTKQVRTRPKLTTRRILECWPLLVWIGIAVIAVYLYRGGVVFVRMNGAVDVYQENITPINEGRLLEIKVIRGKKYPPGTVLAVMDSSKYRLDLESLKRGIIADRLQDIRDFDSDLIKLESELRKIQTEDAEDSAVIKALEALVDASEKPRPGISPELQRALDNDPDKLRSKMELAKAKGRNALNAQQSSSVSEQITRIKTLRDTLQKEADLITTADVGSDAVTKANALRDDELQKFIELKTKIEQCQLITPHGGTVDRIGKEVGEFVVPGDGVLKIVGDPEQVVCFLPQDQANDLKIGRKVWIANTSDKAMIFESEVTGISPRINNLPDATSPLPNRRVHGRDILVKYPDSAKPSAPGDPFRLLPGQTVIIHLEKPGEVPWIDRLFHNDDNDTVR